MKLVVGLGNPGKKYKSTKHNIGFMCLDAYFESKKLKFKIEKRFNGLAFKNGNTMFLKPHTFMNNSGQSIVTLMEYYNVDVEDVLIIYDDLDLPLGKIRLREKGSSGGHNGLKSIINHINTEEFKRVRVGIDSNPLIETKDYVLGKFSKEDLKVVKETISTVEEIIDDFVNNKSFINIMNEYN